jgi:glucan 1,3-beta-glucosidase
MLVTANDFSLLLQTLGLSQGFSKPKPSAVETNVVPDVNRIAFSAHSFLPPAADQALGDVNLQAQLASPADLSLTPSQVLGQTDSSCFVEPYTAPMPLELTFPPFDEATANVYRYRQQQSVNLGSWYSILFCSINFF